MVVQEFKDLMIWDICQQTIAPPLDICHISPDPGGEICHSVFNGKFPWVSPAPPPPSVITMTSALDDQKEFSNQVKILTMNGLDGSAVSAKTWFDHKKELLKRKFQSVVDQEFHKHVT